MGSFRKGRWALGFDSYLSYDLSVAILPRYRISRDEASLSAQAKWGKTKREMRMAILSPLVPQSETGEDSILVVIKEKDIEFSRSIAIPRGCLVNP
jgi:hypothetical protein